MADQSLPRYVNERRILTQLRLNSTMSRADLARSLGLTPATITNLVDNLRQEGLVAEVAATDSPKQQTKVLGRPAVALTLNRRGGCFLGVEIGVGIVRFALVDLALDVVESSAIPTPPGVGPDTVVDLISGHMRTLNRRRSQGERIRAVCITVPGLVRSDGYVVHLPILGWRDVNVLNLASRRLKIPILVENNANAAAFGEAYTQPDLDMDCIVYLKLGMGCGGAVIVNGRLLRGSVGMAAELGHVTVAPGGVECSCGRRGCLESWVNLLALARAYDGSRPWTIEQLRALPDRIVASASSDDEAARGAVASVIKHLAAGLVSLVNTFNPGTILLGGAMRPVVEFGLPTLRRTIAEGIVPGMGMPEIKLSTLGPFECAIGVAMVAHHQAFDVSNIEVTAGDRRQDIVGKMRAIAG